MIVGVPAAFHPEIRCDALEFIALGEVLPSFRSHICCLSGETHSTSEYVSASKMLFPIYYEIRIVIRNQRS